LAGSFELLLHLARAVRDDHLDKPPLGFIIALIFGGAGDEPYNKAVDRASERAWVMQWRHAAVALEEQRRRELRALTEQEALAASDALLCLAAALPLDTRRLTDSGLVRQQALFHRRGR
jgi:hypothetical protein